MLIQQLNEFSSAYVLWLWHGAWQAAVLGTVILLLIRFAPRLPLSIQYSLLLLAMLKFIVPPVTALPIGLFSRIHAEALAMQTDVMDPSLIDSVATDFERYPAREFTPQTPAPPVYDRSQNREKTQPPVSGRLDATSDSTESRELSVSAFTRPTLTIGHAPILRLSWSSYLLIGHLLGTVGFLSYIAVQVIKLHRLAANGQPIDAANLFDGDPSLGALLHGILLLQSPNASVPMAFGILRPTILLPRVLVESERKSLRAVVLHEVAHIRRRDLWVGWLEIAIFSVWWFHPLVWILSRAQSRIREDCCDDFSVERGGTNALEYCETLLHVAKGVSPLASNRLSCGMNDGRLLSRRISRLMNPQRLKAKKLGLLGMSIIGALAVCLLPGINNAQTTNLKKEDDTASGPSLDAIEYLSTSFGDLQVHQISIQGTAVDLAGNPLRNATILVGSALPGDLVGKDEKGVVREFSGELSRVVTDEQGHFEFSDLRVPVQRPPLNYPAAHEFTSKLQLVGIVDDFGMTWSPQFEYRPTAKPAEFVSEKPVYHMGDNINITLQFPPKVPLHGRLTDERGQPIPMATVRMGAILDSQDLIDSISRSTVLSFMEDSPCAASGWPHCEIIPERFRIATTDDQGKYRFDAVPLGVRVGLSFTHERFPSHKVKVIQTTKVASEKGDVGMEGTLDVQVATVRDVKVSALAPEGDLPLPGARFEITSANHDEFMLNSTAVADERGVANLRLIPGDYALRVLPPSHSSYWRSEGRLHVGPEASFAPLRFSLTKSRRLNLRAVIGNNLGIEGVSFEYSRAEDADQNANWERVTTQGATSEYAATDSSGQLIAIVPESAKAVRVLDFPKSYSLRDGRRIHYRVQETDSDQLIQVGFQSVDSNAKTPLSPTLGKLERGRFRFRHNNHLTFDATQKELVEFMQSVDPTDPSVALGQLKEFFRELPLGDQSLIQDGQRRKVTSIYRSRGMLATDIAVNDGLHHIRYSEVNRQCDVQMMHKSRVSLLSIGSLLIGPQSLALQQLDRTAENDRVVYSTNLGGMTLREERDIDDSYIFSRSVIAQNQTRLEWQLCPRRFGESKFPSIVVKAVFRKDEPHKAELTVFDEVELMDSIPGDSFAMSVPGGTTIVDYRSVDEQDAGRRAGNMRLRIATLDLAQRIGQPARHKPGLKYGEVVPAIFPETWILNGQLASRPNLEESTVLLHMCDPKSGRLVENLADLRRAIQRFGEQENVLVVLLLPAWTSTTVATEFQRTHGLNCYVACDGASSQNALGKTFDACHVESLPVTLVINAGTLDYYGYHVGQVIGADATLLGR